MCGSANCNQKDFYVALGDNQYTELVIEFVVDDEPSAPEYVVPFTDEVCLNGKYLEGMRGGMREGRG